MADGFSTDLKYKEFGPARINLSAVARDLKTVDELGWRAVRSAIAHHTHFVSEFGTKQNVLTDDIWPKFVELFADEYPCEVINALKDGKPHRGFAQMMVEKIDIDRSLSLPLHLNMAEMDTLNGEVDRGGIVSLLPRRDLKVVHSELADVVYRAVPAMPTAADIHRDSMRQWRHYRPINVPKHTPRQDPMAHLSARSKADLNIAEIYTPTVVDSGIHREARKGAENYRNSLPAPVHNTATDGYAEVIELARKLRGLEPGGPQGGR